MSRFNFFSTALAGLFIVQRKLVEDDRGFLSRFYCAEEFRKLGGINKPITQINHTLTRKKGAVRGMHFQYPPHSEIKLVSCLKGKILDVAIDLRSTSPTFLQWHGEIISATNRKSLLIPEGFAHGFQALTQNCELIYLHTESYSPEAEGAINATDPKLRIDWPLPISELSVRDRNYDFIDENFQGIAI
jgi:dTDP-4-dehydrorhamnose 3,5-epimerase